jgi:hypothetical protein
MEEAPWHFELLERRSAGQSLTLTFQLIRRHSKLLLGGSLLVALPFYLLAYFLVVSQVGLFSMEEKMLQVVDTGFWGSDFLAMLIFLSAFAMHICFINQFLVSYAKEGKAPVLSQLLLLSLRRLGWYVLGVILWFVSNIILIFFLFIVFMIAGLIMGLTEASDSFFLGVVGFFIGMTIILLTGGYVAVVVLQYFIAADLRKKDIFVGIGKSFEMAHTSGWNFGQTIMAGFIGVLTYFCLSIAPFSVLSILGYLLGWFGGGITSFQNIVDLLTATGLISNFVFPLLVTPLFMFAGVFHLSLSEKSEGIRLRKRIQSFGRHLQFIPKKEQV